MVQMFTGEIRPFTITPLKADGSPGEVDASSVVVASSDETVLRIMSVVPANTSITGQVQAIAESQTDPDGNPIATRFTVTADANLGPGVAMITGVSEDITATQNPATMASTFTIVLGDPITPVVQPIGAPTGPVPPRS